MNKYDMTEFNKLVEYLEAAHYNYEVEPKFDGSMVVVYDDQGHYEWDAIIHNYSYGAKEGLLEAAGAPFGDCLFDIDIMGNATAANIIDVVHDYYAQQIYHGGAF